MAFVQPRASLAHSQTLSLSEAPTAVPPKRRNASTSTHRVARREHAQQRLSDQIRRCGTENHRQPVRNPSVHPSVRRARRP